MTGGRVILLMRQVAGHPQAAVALLAAAYVLALGVAVPEMLSIGAARDVLLAALPLAILAIGQSFVLMVAEINLSVTSSMSFASVIAASIMTQTGGALSGDVLATPAAILVFVVVGAGVGAFNGVCVVKFGMPSFLVSLATMMFLAGAAQWSVSRIAQSASIGDLPASFTAIGYGGAFGASTALLIAGALTLAAYVLMTRTQLGRWMEAVGLNRIAARVSGVPVERVVLAAFILSGVYAGVAAIIYCARIETGTPLLAERSLLLDIIGAAVIGGVSLFGGRGGVGGALMGVLLLTVLDKGLQLLGLSVFMVLATKGAVILAATLVDGLRQRAALSRA